MFHVERRMNDSGRLGPMVKTKREHHQWLRVSAQLVYRLRHHRQERVAHVTVRPGVMMTSRPTCTTGWASVSPRVQHFLGDRPDQQLAAW